MRTTMKKRKENAKRFYNMFMNSNCKKVAIVVQRMESSNPNISRCQFIAVPTSISSRAPVVIAESLLGIEGCFIEMLSDIKDCLQKSYHEDGFNAWLKKTYGFEITYADGLVFMLER